MRFPRLPPGRPPRSCPAAPGGGGTAPGPMPRRPFQMPPPPSAHAPPLTGFLNC